MTVLHHKEDPDGDTRPPACYQLKYRGCSYWSCYSITLIEWLNRAFNLPPKRD
jgi:hypothetical protein